jgi:hypothetical protein
MRTSVTFNSRLLDALVAVVVAVATSAAWGASPATTRSSRNVVDRDLVGHWRADHSNSEEAEDLSGHGRALKPVSGKITVEKVGNRSGFRFTQASSPLGAGPSEDFDFTSDFTVALWVRLKHETGDVTLLCKHKGGSNGWAIVHGIREVGGVGFVAAPRVIVPTPCKAVDDWVHVAVTFHAREFLLYVDGKAIGIMDLPVVPPKSKEPLLVGADALNAKPFDGWIDDVRIYHRGLTDKGVEALAAGKEPADPYRPLTKEEEAKVRKLVGQLGDPSYAIREKAVAGLRGMGRKIMPLLKTYRDSEDPEVSLRIRALLGELPRGGENR